MKRLARWMRRLADWLDPAPDLSVLDQRTAVLVAQAATGGGSGEYKRHQVYAQLIKAFPAVPRRVLGMAIERAVEAL